MCLSHKVNTYPYETLSLSHSSVLLHYTLLRRW